MLDTYKISLQLRVQMNITELTEAYFDGWNKHDAEQVLSLFNDNAL